MFGSFLAPIFFTAYYGLKETLKYTYSSPKLMKKIKGNSGWMEVRFRHPSPGNVDLNDSHAAREQLRNHFKTPYQYSKYYVRNYWDPAKENPSNQTARVIPSLDDFTEKQLALYLGYMKGDDLANQRKKEAYLAKAKELNAKNNPKDYSLETSKRYQSDLRNIFKGFNEQIKEVEEYSTWQDMAEFPGASPYIAGPDTYLQEYSLHHFNSYENHLHIELEKYREDCIPEMEQYGVSQTTGNTDNWQILDSSHRSDQQEEVVKSLKQRNIKNIS
jgi:hypothetical protein